MIIFGRIVPDYRIRAAAARWGRRFMAALFITMALHMLPMFFGYPSVIKTLFSGGL